MHFGSSASRVSTCMKLVAKAVSKLLLIIGGFIFFVGDRVLYEFYKVNYLTRLLVAIGCGVAVMFIGGAIQLWFSKTEGKEGGTRSE